MKLFCKGSSWLLAALLKVYLRAGPGNISTNRKRRFSLAVLKSVW
jgi:hypothetical protein